MGRDRLLELEAEFWEAAGDLDFYRANFAEDGLMAFTVGIMAKAEVLAAVAAADAWSSFTIEDPLTSRWAMMSPPPSSTPPRHVAPARVGSTGPSSPACT
jgi:hypothetical protein